MKHFVPCSICFTHFLLLSFILSTEASPTTSFTLPSGRTIPLAKLHHLGPRVSADTLPYLLFEQIGDRYVRSHLTFLNISLLAPKSEEKITSHNQPITIRSGRGYTFVYNSTSSALVSAWGPGIQFEPIDILNYPGLFVNNVARYSHLHNHSHNSLTAIAGHSLNQTQGLQNSNSYASNIFCSRYYDVEMAAVFDLSFIDIYKEDISAFLHGLSSHLNSVFENSVCIRFSFKQYVYSASGTYPSQTELESCSQNKQCDAARKMLQLVYNRPLGQPSWNGGDVLFTTYGDGTTLGGAAYHASMCNNFRAYGWVIQSSPQVLAHELGHLLGAPHSKTGIMKAVIDTDEPLVLSKNSQAAILRFIRQESLSWCIRRQLTDGKNYLADYDGWLGSPPYIIPSFQKPETRIIDTTVARLFNDSATDIITMYKTESSESTVLTFNVAKNISLDQDMCKADKMYSPIQASRKANETIPTMHLRFSKQNFGFTVSFGHFTESNSKDLVITWLQNSVKGMYTYYRIYYNIPSYVAPLRNRNYRTVVTRDEPVEKVLCTSSTVGHVRRPDSNDLLHVHIEQRKGRSVAYYKVFFDIQSDGKSLGGRTKKIHIPGWFGRAATSVSIALYDLDKNGQPEIIMYHKDETERMKRGFVRIGRNLDSKGVVTGGWSDFVEMGRDTLKKKDDGKYEEGIIYGTAMDVVDIGNADPSIVALSLDYGREKKLLRLSCGNEVLTTKLLSTCSHQIESELADNGCDECYVGHEKRTTCRNEINLCQSAVDNVYFSKSIQFSTARQIDEHNKTLPVAAQKTISQIAEPDNRSLYCEGFHYLQIEKGECLTIERELVVAEGLRRSFLKELSALDHSADEDTESDVLDEVYGGTNGHQLRPVVVDVKLKGKGKAYEKNIEKVFKRIRRKTGIQLNQQKEIGQTTFWDNGDLHVRFEFTRNHVTEI